jgi:chromosome segregation ATPase
LGCGKKADENKPISEVKAEAEKLDTDELRAMAMVYQKAIAAKNGEVEKLTAKLKDIPVTEMLGDEAKELKADIDNLNKSLSALKERFEVYYQKLKEQGGDLSGLQV